MRYGPQLTAISSRWVYTLQICACHFDTMRNLIGWQKISYLSSFQKLNLCLV